MTLRGELVEWAALGRALSTRFALRRCATVGVEPWVRGRLWIHGEGTVRLGDRVRLDGRAAPIELHTLPGAEIDIGDDVVILGGTSIEAHQSVVIGDRCHLASFCKVIDNHFHPLKGARHRRPGSVPVVLEDGVDLGRHAIVLPGARLRRDAVVGAGAVVRGATLALVRAPPPAQAVGRER